MTYNEISVVTTTYNEEENIGELIKRIRGLGFKVYMIVVDDSSTDNTAKISYMLANKTIVKKREGQTIGLWYGILNSKDNIVVTIDADLENPPELIPFMLNEFIKNDCGVLVASRDRLPRFSEKMSSKIFKKIIKVNDVYSNFRIYKKQCLNGFTPRLGETFGLELLLFLKKNKCKFCEFTYHAPPRRANPRIGGKVKANIRALNSTLKSLIGDLIYYRG
ncbi:glycosyl transferase [Caldisphaera lagunensis DSM 15908]|uniref:Glycosyl transferase n=1 Tax=Caldisphaera lagunensis (strain DSM 15908 / JCM 11604 / ANMR 0165 / IC-154) TaxID=1056495 RepID=L0A9D5_CALLD|nr:glycosyltransferase family 2 protein [Caldisphaera lagunensis]AFZ70034.1 glycosyl transferase [Caldisphaera lagunensis DSM 15908]